MYCLTKLVTSISVIKISRLSLGCLSYIDNRLPCTRREINRIPLSLNKTTKSDQIFACCSGDSDTMDIDFDFQSFCNFSLINETLNTETWNFQCGEYGKKRKKGASRLIGQSQQQCLQAYGRIGRSQALAQLFRGRHYSPSGESESDTHPRPEHAFVYFH